MIKGTGTIIAAGGIRFDVKTELTEEEWYKVLTASDKVVSLKAGDGKPDVHIFQDKIIFFSYERESLITVPQDLIAPPKVVGIPKVQMKGRGTVGK